MAKKLRVLLAARFVVAILVIAAIAPGVSRTLATVLADGLPFATLCSASEMPSGDAAATVDCPACVLHHQAALTPPHEADASTYLRRLSDARPFLFLRAPRPLFAWAGAQPRAPPRLV